MMYFRLVIFALVIVLQPFIKTERSNFFTFHLNKRSAGYVDSAYYWNDSIVPYELWPSFYYPSNKHYYDRLMQAIVEIELVSSIRFLKRNQTHEDYVMMHNDNESCFSEIGKQGGVQIASVGKGCQELGNVVHELLHALGVWHTISREDRDDYVTILWENIKRSKYKNFLKISQNYVSWFNISYDYDSIMHYNAYQFSKNGRVTIISNNPQKRIGQRRSLSEGDIEILSEMYPSESSKMCGIPGYCVKGRCISNVCNCHKNWFGDNCNFQCSRCLRGSVDDSCMLPECANSCTYKNPCVEVLFRYKQMPIFDCESFKLNCSDRNSSFSFLDWNVLINSKVLLTMVDYGFSLKYLRPPLLSDVSRKFQLKSIDIFESDILNMTSSECSFLIEYSYTPKWELHSLEILLTYGDVYHTFRSYSLRTLPGQLEPQRKRHLILIGKRMNFSVTIRMKLYQALEDFVFNNLEFFYCYYDSSE